VQRPIHDHPSSFHTVQQEIYAPQASKLLHTLAFGLVNSLRSFGNRRKSLCVLTGYNSTPAEKLVRFDLLIKFLAIIKPKKMIGYVTSVSHVSELNFEACSRNNEASESADFHPLLFDVV